VDRMGSMLTQSGQNLSYLMRWIVPKGTERGGGTVSTPDWNPGLQNRLCLTAYSTSMMKIDMFSSLKKPTLKLNTP